MSNSSCIRVRLLFDDCTPFHPGGVGRRKCWFLLNADACRRITDVEHCIRETFRLGKSSHIELLLDDFVLPPFERSELIHENDIIRVRLLESDSLPSGTSKMIHSGHQDNRSTCKDISSDGSSRNESLPSTSTFSVGSSAKKRKKEKTQKHSKTVENVCIEYEGQDPKSQKDCSKTTREVVQATVISHDGMKCEKKSRRKKLSQMQRTQLAKRARRRSTSSSDSEDNQQSVSQRHGPAVSSIAGRTNGSHISALGSRKTDSNQPRVNGNAKRNVATRPVKPAAIGRVVRSKAKADSSDSESSSTEEENATLKKPTSISPHKKTVNSCPGSSLARKTKSMKQPSSSSSSTSSLSSASESEKTTQMKTTEKVKHNKKPLTTIVSSTASGVTVHALNPAKERILATPSSVTVATGVKKSQSKSSDKHVRFSSESENGAEEEDVTVPFAAAGQIQTSVEGENVANRQVVNEQLTSALRRNTKEAQGVGEEEKSTHDCPTPDHEPVRSAGNVLMPAWFQTPAAAEKPQPKDYSTCPPLVGPPRVGDVIAYKVLELSSSYTPEVSEYKEGEVVNMDHSTSMIELKLSTVTMAAQPSRDGGRFEMEMEEDAPVQTNSATPPDRLVLVTLPSLIDPKLVT